MLRGLFSSAATLGPVWHHSYLQLRSQPLCWPSTGEVAYTSGGPYKAAVHLPDENDRSSRQLTGHRRANATLLALDSRQQAKQRWPLSFSPLVSRSKILGWQICSDPWLRSSRHFIVKETGVKLVTPTPVIQEGGASSETGYFLPMVLVKCCHASGSRRTDGLYDTPRVTALAQVQLGNI